MRQAFILSCSLALAPLGVAQELHRGLTEADVVVVARQVGKKPFGEEVELHRLQVIDDVRGARGNNTVTVLDWPKLSLHARPTPRQSRLYCLQDASVTAAKLGLPANDGPYYRMVGWPGSNPLVAADVAHDPNVAFARVLAASETGAAPAETAAALCTMTLGAEQAIRQEAARFLIQRPVLRTHLTSVQWDQVLTRACGEVDDVPYKIALAELCAEQRLDGLLDALVVSLGPVTDPEFARAVGRIGKLLRGEKATEVLEQRLRIAAKPEDRAALLLAMGASNTRSALDALQRMDRTDKAVEAALQEHRGWKKAQDADGRRK